MMAEYIPVLVDATDLKVLEKYRQLSEAALAPDSIYMRAKDTFKELLDTSGLTKTEYAQLASQFISGLATQTTVSVMNTAMQWATQEKEMAYSLAQAKANISMTLANIAKVDKDILLTDKQIELQKVQTIAAMAVSIRENGRVATVAADGYTPVTLNAEGSKYVQEQLIKSQEYASMADAYRKSGLVQTGVDADGVKKGLTGDVAGYTQAQDKYARRQLLSFEDSKRSHAANAVSQLIGQLVASEIVPAASYVAQWDKALTYLTTNTVDANGDGLPDIA
jgi:hypothetical protein